LSVRLIGAFVRTSGRNENISRRQFGRWAAVAGLAGTAATGCSAATSGGSPNSAAPVGFVLSHEQFPTPDLLSLAEQAEQAGFGYVWASDHLQPWQDNEGHAMSPWLTLALVAQSTQRIALGTGVTCPIYRHHPTDVAQAFASLALLAPGRAFLGVGTGEKLNEQAGTGQFGPYAERHDRLAEAIDLIRRLWTGQRISYRGHYFQTEQLKLYDLPTHPPPIYVAAGGPKTARLAGQYGDGWITQSSSVTDPKLQNAFADGARVAGKNPDTMPRWAELFAVVGDQNEIDRAAQLWRFTAARQSLDQPNPVAIQQAAERTVPLQQVAARWVTGTDVGLHVRAVQRLLDSRVTPFLHFPQHDPSVAINFYRHQVLPLLKR
jgi:F420-dependent hydroxymycolic acid dehydrogenase